jgi:hypothetical protein
MSSAATSSDEVTEDGLVESLLRCYYLAEFFSECFVEDKYKPPPSIATLIALTPKGKTLTGHGKGDGVSPFEAHLAAFLTMWAGDELLVDPEKTQIDGLRDLVSGEIKRGRIKFPWIYGRELYDAVAESTFHGDAHPSYEETFQLLEKLPPGVFQLGPYICGPYGLIESDHWRLVSPNLVVPGFHCDEVDCHRIHGVHLAPGENGVTKARSVIRRRIAKLHKQDVRYTDAVIKFQADKMPPFSWADTRSLPFFLFDCFDDSDIRALLVRLINGRGSDLRKKCAELELTVQNADKFAAGLSNPEALQILLLVSDIDIHRALNEMIWTGQVQVPEGEIRTTQIISGGTGPLDVRMEASHLGVRYTPGAALAQVRMRSIIDRCYPLGDSERQTRLKWLLREIDGEASASKLEHALTSDDPLETTKRLLASDEHSYRITLRELSIPDDAHLNSSDEEIARLISWHIGFTLAEGSTELSRLLHDLAVLKRIIRGLPEGRLGPAALSQIRQLSSDLFVNLEEVLKHALTFICYSLLHDHFMDGYVLEYSRNRASGFFSTWLETQTMKTQGADIDRFALGDLMECFGTLGKHFRRISEKPEDFLRPAASLPRSFRLVGDNPFNFPFRHTHPFLDLDQRSREHLVRLVVAVASSFSTDKVLDVRNGLMHHTPNVPESTVIGDALNSIEARVTELASNGLYPLVYRIASSDSDSYGRRRILLTSADGPEVTLVRPNGLDRTGFPRLGSAQSVIVGSRLGNTGEPLRFTWKVDSTYQQRWNNFPKRPPVRNVGLQSADALE